ncbi:hypothetical protein N7517_000942 [Penicillium concentricum]|uniref:Uncharacterized protein n=1 Tax=Penicillium concentricum TaxID=293559 RepID=A0A9W9SR85_9EURO|nr:uncharacterized protein N7517_000942 [Penicillium concentricum]KAJ5383031.1 hypothetical protein N7517_000942 [Penicillium concentricum]
MDMKSKIKELLLVTPHTPTVTRKRKVIPSPERSSPTKSCILSPDAVFTGNKVLRLGDKCKSKVDDAFKLVFDFFNENQISITDVQYWGKFFVIVLEDEETDLTKVPCDVGCCNCFYLFENEVGRPQ